MEPTSRIPIWQRALVIAALLAAFAVTAVAAAATVLGSAP